MTLKSNRASDDKEEQNEQATLRTFRNSINTEVETLQRETATMGRFRPTNDPLKNRGTEIPPQNSSNLETDPFIL
ncbi:BAF_HP2_G0015610.mRNA.1.CDS.1 [Saccharomyces cerevisiae]|nr:BAF_HP2_G0015610.mRNA.1.CDS.1 [Saccharomyces cerevisiae]CAI6598720.1 BAF_HP2_G0015610.mRNA.1.CDS.1 [Saccharomyces cerevisiae]